MLKKLLLSFGILLAIAPIASAEMLLFMRDGCIHCENLSYDLENYNAFDNHEIETVYIDAAKDNMTLYLEAAKKVGYTAGGVPLLIDGLTHVEGRTPILNHLGYNAESFESAGSSLSAEDSQRLNELIKEEVKSPRTLAEKIFWIVTVITAFMLLWYNLELHRQKRRR